MLSLKNFITKIYYALIGKYEIIYSAHDIYTNYYKTYISRRLLKDYNVKKKHGYKLVNDIQDNEIYHLDQTFTDYEKGERYLFMKWNGKVRIATCTGVVKNSTMPPIFDGNETPGIGYDVIGKLIK